MCALKWPADPFQLSCTPHMRFQNSASKIVLGVRDNKSRDQENGIKSSTDDLPFSVWQMQPRRGEEKKEKKKKVGIWNSDVKSENGWYKQD